MEITSPQINRSETPVTAFRTIIKFLTFIFFFLMASIGTAIAYQNAIVSLKGLKTSGIVIETEPTRTCILTPPNFQCTYIRVEFTAKNGEMFAFNKDLTFAPSLFSTVPVVYLEKTPRIAEVTTGLARDFLTGSILIIIGWIGVIAIKPLRTLKNFVEVSAYGPIPILFPETDRIFKSRPLLIVGVILLGAFLTLFLWALLNGLLIGFFWAPVVTFLLLYYISYFGFLKISNRVFLVGVILLAIYLYFLFAYSLVYLTSS